MNPEKNGYGSGTSKRGRGGHGGRGGRGRGRGRGGNNARKTTKRYEDDPAYTGPKIKKNPMVHNVYERQMGKSVYIYITIQQIRLYNIFFSFH